MSPRLGGWRESARWVGVCRGRKGGGGAERWRGEGVFGGVKGGRCESGEGVVCRGELVVGRRLCCGGHGRARGGEMSCVGRCGMRGGPRVVRPREVGGPEAKCEGTEGEWGGGVVGWGRARGLGAASRRSAGQGYVLAVRVKEWREHDDEVHCEREVIIKTNLSNCNSLRVFRT